VILSRDSISSSLQLCRLGRQGDALRAADISAVLAGQHVCANASAHHQRIQPKQTNAISYGGGMQILVEADKVVRVACTVFRNLNCQSASDYTGDLKNSMKNQKV
jgi:hypothetical protein